MKERSILFSGEPTAWITYGACTGEPILSFEPLSELASEPLYKGMSDAAAADVWQAFATWKTQRFEHYHLRYPLVEWMFEAFLAGSVCTPNGDVLRGQLKAAYTALDKVRKHADSTGNHTLQECLTSIGVHPTQHEPTIQAMRKAKSTIESLLPLAANGHFDCTDAFQALALLRHAITKDGEK